MQLSTLFSRAWQQKYLTPAERAIYKFTVALIVLIPSSVLLGGVDSLLAWLHASAPVWLWTILGVLVPALLLALAKYATAHSDPQVGAIIQQVEHEAAQDLGGSKVTALGTKAYTPPEPTPITLPGSPVPPRSSASAQTDKPQGA